PVFAQRTVGDGVSIDPTSCEVLAPAAGLVTLMHRAAHALAITTDEGVEILVHIGVDTVSLNGKGFTARVSQGDRVAAGQPLISFDADLIARSAPSLLTQVLVTNRERIGAMTVATGLVDAGRSVILDVELAAAPAVDGAPATEATAVSADIRLPNRQGLHARPAAVVAAAAKAFRADIRLLRGADAANAKSVTSILLLATNPNDAIRVSAPAPDAAARILDAHLELLADPELIDLAVAGLAGGRSAGFAWREAYSRYAARLEALSSALLRERAGDVRDVGGRVLGLLAGVTTAPLE